MTQEKSPEDKYAEAKRILQGIESFESEQDKICFIVGTLVQDRSDREARSQGGGKQEPANETNEEIAKDFIRKASTLGAYEEAHLGEDEENEPLYGDYLKLESELKAVLDAKDLQALSRPDENNKPLPFGGLGTVVGQASPGASGLVEALKFYANFESDEDGFGGVDGQGQYRDSKGNLDKGKVAKEALHRFGKEGGRG